MKHKNEHSCIAIFPDGKAKKWSYVHKLSGFIKLLNEKHQGWQYVNIYDRRTAKYLKRFYPGDLVPDFLTVFIIALMFLSLQFLQFSYPLNSTFGKRPLTFNNGFNNTATISTLIAEKGGLHEPS